MNMLEHEFQTFSLVFWVMCSLWNRREMRANTGRQRTEIEDHLPPGVLAPEVSPAEDLAVPFPPQLLCHCSTPTRAQTKQTNSFLNLKCSVTEEGQSVPHVKSGLFPFRVGMPEWEFSGIYWLCDPDVHWEDGASLLHLWSDKPIAGSEFCVVSVLWAIATLPS